MLQAKLRVVGGRHHGKVIPLATKKFLIGREQDCHLRPNSELISRHHCVFSVDDYSVRLRDLGSTNGTFVNDHRVRGEVSLNAGDRVRVGKLDFELLIGEPVAASVAGAAAPTNGRGNVSDSSQLLTGLPSNASVTETAPLVGTDTSFEIPVAPVAEDTGSSILPNEPDTAVTPPPPAPQLSDSTVVWAPPAATGYPPEGYPPMSVPYPQNPYQPAYPYMTPPGYGYQPPMGYPQMPMGYPGMYPPMGGYSAPVYSPPPAQQQPAPPAEPVADSGSNASIPEVRLPDPKTTGAKAPPPPPPPAEKPANEATPNSDAKEEKKPEATVKPTQAAADILKNYTQRRPV